MVDFVKSKTYVNDIPEEILNGVQKVFDWRDFVFYPNENLSFTASKNSMHEKGLNELNLKFVNGVNGNIQVSNSFHKFFDNGMNHTDFTRNQIKECAKDIESSLGFDFINSTLYGRLEFAVNIEVKNTSDIFQSQIKFRGIDPEPMLAKKNKRYGTRFRLSAYQIKCYDPIKKLELKGIKSDVIEKETLRFELVTTASYLRQRGVNVTYVKDLYNRDTLRDIGTELLAKTKSISNSIILPNSVEMKDASIYHLFKNSTQDQLKHFRENQRSTYYRQKRRFNKILKHYNNESLKITDRVNEKWLELLES